MGFNKVLCALRQTLGLPFPDFQQGLQRTSTRDIKKRSEIQKF